MTVSPTVTTNYYLRAEGICMTTTCASITITVNDSSWTATGLTYSSDTICPGINTTLALQEVFLGTSAGWVWYTGSCGGTAAGNGTSIVVNPLQTTVYYVRGEGICNTTVCINGALTVNDTSIAANGITAVQQSICESTSTTLGVSGGVLGTMADWYWYSNGCGGNPEGNGTTITVSPSVTMSYYVRAEGLCNTTTCVNIQVTVKDSSEMGTGITTSLDTVCEGLPVTMTVTGGMTGTNATWQWYTGGCGNTPAGVGGTITFNPVITTDYYVRAEGDCNTTNCTDMIITVNSNSLPVAGMTISMPVICNGVNDTLGITGGYLGAISGWYWYSGGCGMTFEGNGTGIVVAPSVTTEYYIRAEGLCNTTTCGSIQVTVLPLPAPPVTLTTDSNGICSDAGINISLTASGGSGGELKWYTGGCEVTLVGSGTTITITMPTITTTYYANWHTISCGNSGCESIDITIIPMPVDPLTATASPDTVSAGLSTTLGVTGVLSVRRELAMV